MQKIPLVDLRSDSLLQLVEDFPERVTDLVLAPQRKLGPVSGWLGKALLPRGDRIARAWMLRTNNPYLGEIDAFAARLKLAGIYALNICFEWGCTSSVYAKPEGPVLTRVMDWLYPKLGTHLVVARHNSAPGAFYNVTWPGVSGMFQGVAPGRFAAALNQAPMQRHRRTSLGDWYINRRRVFQGDGLPPEHLLRQTFEQARNYADAKARLCTTPVALPVIFILGGLAPGEGCVIERTERDFAVRPLEGDRVCASNQFDTRLNQLGYGWRPRPVDSAGRVRLARALALDAIDDGFRWFLPPVANSHTRLALIACAATGRLSVFGTQGVAPVTEILRVG